MWINRVRTSYSKSLTVNLIIYSDLRQERTNKSLSSVSSAILHLLAVSTWAAALNSLSTAAELGKVELLFWNATASAGYAIKLSTELDFDAK